MNRICKIIELYGPRLAGSKACRDAANYLCNEFEKYCDKSGTEDFVIHPDAFLGWIKIIILSYIVTLVGFWFNLPIVGMICGISSLILVTFEFVYYYHFADRFYPSSIGRNVYGIIEPDQKVERTIVFSGHHDSAKRFTFYETTPNLMMIRGGGGLLSFVAINLLSFIFTAMQLYNGESLFNPFKPMSSITRTINIIMSILLVFVITAWNFVLDEGTPGAGDNLITCSIAVELARYYSENRPKNTRLVFASFDGEEAGLRGSRAFWKNHAKEFGGKNCYNLNVDSPFFLDELTILLTDINGTISLTESMGKQIISIGKNLGIFINQKKIPFMLGGTDAAEAVRAGVRGMTVIGLPWKPGERESIYHTMKDLPEAIEHIAVESVFKIAMKYIEVAEEGSLQ